jgi:hypothetical protein
MLEHKCALLQKFNSASDGKKAKIEIWGKIFRKMEANGYNGSMEKLRDTEYQNIRKATMKKRDKISVSGSGGDGTYSELDQLVLTYIGKDSAVLDGLCEPESRVARPLETNPVAKLAQSCSSSHPPTIQVGNEIGFLGLLQDDTSHDDESGSTHAVAKTCSGNNESANDRSVGMKSKRLARDQLINTNLELQNKKLRLEILLLEQKLLERGVAPPQCE